MCLSETDVKLLFQLESAKHFDHPESDRKGSAVAPTSVRFRGTIGGGPGRPRDGLGRLSHYAMHEGASPHAPGLLRVDRPLGHLSVRSGTYRRGFNGVAVYRAFVTRPGSLGGLSVLSKATT